MIRGKHLLMGVAGVAAVSAVAATAVAVTIGLGDATPTKSADARGPDVAALATAFLDDWVEDGRVVRHDQGGDTVSEGQAYGLFAAILANDEQSFDEIWDWTDSSLRRDDGLLAWRWADGTIVDDQPAADADLDAARALVVAGERFERPDLQAEGEELGGMVLDHLTVQTDAGRILLAGLWASESPHAYNPSYASPAAYQVLSAATGDPRWGELAEGSVAVTDSLLDAAPLPADWAQVHPDGRIDVMPGAEGRGDDVQYGFEAARLPLRFAESCSAGDNTLAAAAYDALPQSGELSARLDLGGAALSDERSPLAYAARAAAAAASGHDAAAVADLERAEELAAEIPTYYGAAWALLGTAMLTSDELGGCPPLGQATAEPATAALDAGSLQDPVTPQTPGDEAVPTRIRIPSIGVDTSLENLGLQPDGELTAPESFTAAGWYADGVVPGEVGPAIIAGHVDSWRGPAVFVDLEDLAPGDDVIVTLSDDTERTFEITGATQSTKSTFPTSDVYHNTPTPQLRLITCAGTFDTSSRDYSDNLIVFAAMR